MTREQVVKVMDFGVAKVQSDTSMTKTGVLCGTPQYMAPEHFTGSAHVTAAADIYALGVVAYRMMTGQVPFKSSVVFRLIMMHVRDTPRPIRESRPDVPDALDRIIQKAMAKSVDDRYANCKDMAEDLRKLARGFAR